MYISQPRIEPSALFTFNLSIEAAFTFHLPSRRTLIIYAVAIKSGLLTTMWISTTRKSRVCNNSSSNQSASPSLPEDVTVDQRRSSTSASVDAIEKDDWQSTVPLDWTLINHRKRNVSDAGDSNDNNCIDSINCRCTRRHLPLSSCITTSNTRETSFNVINTSDFTQGKPSSILRGQAIFCLHDLDPYWVQGYFVPDGSTKPWGLLAIQEQIDDCLACSDGGYRRVSLTVYAPTQQRYLAESTVGVSRPKLRTLSNIDWVGGDMMTLYHPDHINMIAEQLLTGESALPLLHKYFGGLLKRLQPQSIITGDEREESVLEWLPNVALVKGSMMLVYPEES
jgi:hypothetical protein